MKSNINAKAINYDPVVLLQLSFFALAICFLLASTPAWSAQYYVATTGDNLNSGLSLSLPFKTIQKAMDTAIAGDTVFVRGGVYRETVTVAKGGGTAGNLVTVQGYNGEVPVIKGSDVVTGWTQYNSTIWKKTGWAVNSQQVFVDFNDAQPSKPLQQIGLPSTYYTTYEYPSAVGSGLSTMVPGSFYYDAAATTLYVWLPDGSDPNTHVMEASTRGRLFFMGMPYIYLKGFAFRHSNNSAIKQQAAAVELSSNSVIDQCDIQQTDFAGLQMGYMQSNTQAINCNISNNGDSGINAAATYNFRVANVTMNNNNYRNFNTLWHAGGFKAATKAYGTVEFSEASGNNGSGIWFDYCNGGSAITVRNNYVHNNGPKEAGIFFEVSKNGLIYNNVLANNTRRGIYISASDNTRVFNNTVFGTKVYSAIEVGGMPRTGATLTYNSVTNNIISHNTTNYDLWITPDNGTTILGNTSNYNNFYRPTGSLVFFSSVINYGLSAWQTATKQDMNSLNVNPGFVNAVSPAAATDLALQAISPIIDRATTLSAVPRDYVNGARPAGAAYDMGAFEYAATATTTTTTTTPPPTTTTTTTTPTADTTAPSVTVSNPATDGVTVKNSLSVAASATDNVKVSSMKLYVDGVLKAQTSTAQISYNWDTHRLSRGSTHYILVAATDAALNLTQVTRKVTVQ